MRASGAVRIRRVEQCDSLTANMFRLTANTAMNTHPRWLQC